MTIFRIGLIVVVLAGLIFSSCNRHIAQHKVAKQYYYDCPVHHDYISYQPGKCPKCGLTLDQWELKDMRQKSSGSSNSGNSGSGGHSGGCH